MDKESAPDMQQVFNDDPNCFDYPYILKRKGRISDLNIATQQYYDESDLEYDVCTFKNPQHFNDFVTLYNPKSNETEPFFATIKNNGLLFDNATKVSIKEDMAELGEDAYYFEKLAAFESISDTVYVNRSHFVVGSGIGFSIKYYQFDQENNIYHSPNLKGVEDLHDFEYGAPENKELLPYARMKMHSTKKMEIKMDKNPIFVVECD